MKNISDQRDNSLFANYTRKKLDINIFDQKVIYKNYTMPDLMEKKVKELIYQRIQTRQSNNTPYINPTFLLERQIFLVQIFTIM